MVHISDPSFINDPKHFSQTNILAQQAEQSMPFNAFENQRQKLITRKKNYWVVWAWHHFLCASFWLSTMSQSKHLLYLSRSIKYITIIKMHKLQSIKCIYHDQSNDQSNVSQLIKFIYCNQSPNRSIAMDE